jgi:hypothetical protein
MALVKYNNNSISAITATASLPAGSMTLIKTVTASSSANISFVHGTSDVVLDNTYPIYVIKFINCHPGHSSRIDFQFNLSADTGSNYNVTKTTSAFHAYIGEGDPSAVFAYYQAQDLAQSTGYQMLGEVVGNGADECISGHIYLFNPSSTTYIKHFLCQTSYIGLDGGGNAYIKGDRLAGYANTTSAVDAINFQFASGNIDAGTFKLYGIKDS